MTQTIEQGISLKGITRTNKTAPWFTMAARTGNKSVLSMNDVLSYGIYGMKFLKCGTGGGFPVASCQRRLSRWDGELVRERRYTPETVWYLLEQFSPKEQINILQGALLVMENAKRLFGSK